VKSELRRGRKVIVAAGAAGHLEDRRVLVIGVFVAVVEIDDASGKLRLLFQV
jgi:hypothetical protein